MCFFVPPIRLRQNKWPFKSSGFRLRPETKHRGGEADAVCTGSELPVSLVHRDTLRRIGEKKPARCRIGFLVVLRNNIRGRADQRNAKRDEKAGKQVGFRRRSPQVASCCRVLRHTGAAAEALVSNSEEVETRCLHVENSPMPSVP